MKKGTPLFDRHSRKKKEKPPEPIGKEDVIGKAQWMKEQKAFLRNKAKSIELSNDEKKWLREIEDRLITLTVASA